MPPIGIKQSPLTTCPLLYQVRDRELAGDTNGAEKYSKTAKSLNVAVLGLSILLVIVLIVLFSAGVLLVSH